jgi:hypothetical protein
VLVVDCVVELTIVDVDVLVTVVERVVDVVGENVVVVCRGGVVTLARPKIPLAGELETTKTPTSESNNARPRTLTRRVFFRLLIRRPSAIGLPPILITFRTCQPHPHPAA